jgi:hypothetical protein
MEKRIAQGISTRENQLSREKNLGSLPRRQKGSVGCLSLPSTLDSLDYISIVTPDLLSRAKYVTITFVNQKSGKKMDLRTQRRTGEPVLCPVLRYISVVRQILCQNPLASKDTQLNMIRIGTQTGTITNDYIRDLLRTTCSSFGGKETFGYAATEIGNKSIRSGAAMALFLDNTSSTRIMLLGRWASTAFLAYGTSDPKSWSGRAT